MAGNPRINSFDETADRIFAGTNAGIYSSGDGGKSWQKTSVTARTISLANSGKTIYAGTQSAGLFASKDQGFNWTPVTSLASRNIRSLLAAQGRLYVGTDADGVMVPLDQGVTWIAYNAGLPPLSQIFAMAVCQRYDFRWILRERSLRLKRERTRLDESRERPTPRARC